MRESRLAIGSALLLLVGCVLPTDEPTGLELSWRFLEVNDLDGEEAQRYRTCRGSFIDELVIDIVDSGDDTRRDTFRYDCPFGYQTPTELQTDSSDAFVELRPRDYDVTVDLVGTLAEDAEQLRVRRARDLTVEVLSRTITLQEFDFGLEPVELALVFDGADACDQVAFTFRYADPERDLAEPPRREDGTVGEVIYRERLTTDLGTSLVGEPIACAELAREHRVLSLDPGAYELLVTRDGQECAIASTVGQQGAEHVIDLANLPCDG